MALLAHPQPVRVGPLAARLERTDEGLNRGGRNEALGRGLGQQRKPGLQRKLERDQAGQDPRHPVTASIQMRAQQGHPLAAGQQARQQLRRLLAAKLVLGHFHEQVGGQFHLVLGQGLPGAQAQRVGIAGRQAATAFNSASCDSPDSRLARATHAPESPGLFLSRVRSSSRRPGSESGSAWGHSGR